MKDITSAYTDAIDDAIKDSESGMKTWVNETLANGYYTITQMDAKLEVLSKADEALSDDIKKQKTALETARNELTEAYKQAIEDAISKHNGEITAKIDTVNADLNAKISNINTELAKITEQVNTNKENIKDILDRLDALEKENDALKIQINCLKGLHVWDESKTSAATWNDDYTSCTVSKTCKNCENTIFYTTENITCNDFVLTAKFEQDIDDVTLDISDISEMSADEIKKVVGYMVSIGTAESTTVKLNLAADADSTVFEAIVEALQNAKDGSVNLTLSGAKTIGEYSFYGCTALKSLILSDGVKSIGECAFYGCTSLTSLTIGSGVTSMGDNAFRGCSTLNDLTIKEGVMVIGKNAFSYCSAIESVTIPDSVTTINDYAFYNCTSLKTLTIGSGVTSMGGATFKNCSALKDLTIKEGVKVIGYSTFCNCTALENVTIPDGVTTIGEIAFYGCTALKTLTVGSVEEIGERAFDSCKGLETLTLKEGIKSIGDSAFKDTSLKSVTIPDSVTSIGSQAFYKCTSLTTLTIGSGVEKMGIEAFYECTSLTTLTLKDGIKVIGKGAFYKCSALTSVTVPDSVTTIEASAFSKCSSITEITIGAGVTELVYPFDDTSSLISLTFRAPITKVHSSTFDNVDTENITLTLAKGQKILTRNSGASVYEETDDLFAGGMTFCGMTFKKIISTIAIDATTMSTSDLQTALENYVSKGTTNFEITLAANADSDVFTAIKNGFASASEKSVTLTLKGNITSIPVSAFEESKWIKSISIPDSVTSIDIYAFYNSTLETITLGKNVASIGLRAFWGTSIKEIIIPKSVTSLGFAVFGECDLLETIKYEGTFEEWGAIIKTDELGSWNEYISESAKIVFSNATVTP